MTRRSLSSQLVVSWVATLAIVFFTLPATVYLPLAALRIGDIAEVGLESWTTRRARGLVIDALRADASGTMRIEVTHSLLVHMRRNPEFRFAVFEPKDGALLPGSSAELASNFDASANVQSFGTMFHLADDPNPDARGYDRIAETPIGRMRIIVYGAYFHWDDVLQQLYNHLKLINFVAFVPLCAAVAAVAWFVVRRCLAPLRSAAAEAAAVDVNSLDRRIAPRDLPTEVLPFVEAVNSAFDRVRDGVERHRRFTANAAHELRTPVAILRARVDRLSDMPLKHDIERDVRRIQTIVDQLLILARLGGGSDKKSDREIDLGRTVLAITADYMPIAIDNRRNIAFEPPPAPVAARIDGWAVESIVANLVENAVRAEPEGGTVVVRVLPEAVIEVADHGEGVAPDDRERIFEAFWRKNDASRGAGLGLAIVRELLDELHGSIEVRTTEGGGATFVVRLRSA
ncbi:HAMP domain-containing sensor histidine kinase [Methylosinus sp. PW1]|uniref:sensor histidine kinase n=1 Tax=Methylosinus sp. PW1 TaxID=107636 RepID=UPI0009FDA203|nr:HAMP domain-containing sensor histidine kinase [Methylosinus sp. PW1]